MTRRKARVTQLDIRRTLSAARDAGIQVERFEVDHSTGKVVIYGAKDNEKGAVGFPDPDRLCAP